MSLISHKYYEARCIALCSWVKRGEVVKTTESQAGTTSYYLPALPRLRPGPETSLPTSPFKDYMC